MIAWYDADPARRKVNEEFNRTCDRIIGAWESVWPKQVFMRAAPAAAVNRRPPVAK
jgi:hypothetical protein